MVALLAVTSAAFFLHPLAVLLCVCLIAVVTPTNDFKWFFLVAACALFTILNVSRELDGDLINYVGLQEYVSVKSFFTLFHKEELQLISGTYRLTEIGYYAPVWLVSQVIQDPKTAIGITATLGIYIPTFLGLAAIGKSENWSKGLILTTALFTFFAGINFVQTTHLIRQYMSGALLFYSFALFLSGQNRRWAILIALGACSVHNGTAMVIPLVAVSSWFFRWREGAKLGVGGIFIRVALMLILLTLTMLIIPILQGEFKKEDVPNIQAGHFIVVGAFFVIAHIAIQMQHLRLKSFHYARVAFLTIYALSLAFFIVGLPLFALRYFVYLEWLYGLMVGGIMFTLFQRSPGLQVFARFSVGLAAAAILIVRINASDFMYGPGDNHLLSWDFFQVAQLISR